MWYGLCCLLCRLHLPGEVVEDGREKASYNVDSGTIVVHLPKRNRGEHFENLEMLTTLLSGKNHSTDLSKMGSNPLIEVMGCKDFSLTSPFTGS